MATPVAARQAPEQTHDRPPAHPYLRPVLDMEMAEYRRRLEAHISSSAFRSRVQQLMRLGNTSPQNTRVAPTAPQTRGGRSGSGGRGGGGGAGDVGEAAEGILISAGGPRLLTNLVVLLRVLRLHLNCSLPVEVAWAGPEEVGARAPPGETTTGSSAGVVDEGEEEEQPFIQALRAAGLGPVYGLDLSRVPYPAHHRRPPRLTHWGAKVFALLASSRFRRVLLLDADNLPLADPRFTMFPLLGWRPQEASDVRQEQQQAWQRQQQQPQQQEFESPYLPGERSSGGGGGGGGDSGIHNGHGSGGEAGSSGSTADGGGILDEDSRPHAATGGFLMWPDAWRGWAGPAAYRELGLDTEAARVALGLQPPRDTAAHPTAADDGAAEEPAGPVPASAFPSSPPSASASTSVSGPHPVTRWWPRRDAESGAVLIDRAAHADVLEYLWWINSFGDRLYHRVLHGDKDTFALAFAAAGKAHCYRQVEVPPGGVFQWGRQALEFKLPPLQAHASLPAAGATVPDDPPPPRQPPPPRDGWQLVGFTQHHPATGSPLLLHRTMNKWRALKLPKQPPSPPPPLPQPAPPATPLPPELSRAARYEHDPAPPYGLQAPPQQQGGAAIVEEAEAVQKAGRAVVVAAWRAAAAELERGWPVQVLTGPLPTRWCEYYLAHDSRGPTKGIWWEHVVPRTAIRLFPHPASWAAVTGPLPPHASRFTSSSSSSSSPSNIATVTVTNHSDDPGEEHWDPRSGAVRGSELPPRRCNPHQYRVLLRGAAAGLPTAGSAAAAALHSACGPALWAAMRDAVAAATVAGAAADGASDGATSGIAAAAAAAAAAAGTDGDGSDAHKGFVISATAGELSVEAAVAAATAAMLWAPWRLGDHRLAAALVEVFGEGLVDAATGAVMNQTAAAPSGAGVALRLTRRDPGALPDWPALHAALFRSCLMRDEHLLEAPYGAPSPPSPWACSPPEIQHQPPSPTPLMSSLQIQNTNTTANGDGARAATAPEPGAPYTFHQGRHRRRRRRSPHSRTTGSDGGSGSSKSARSGKVAAASANVDAALQGWPLPPPTPLPGLALCVAAPGDAASSFSTNTAPNRCPGGSASRRHRRHCPDGIEQQGLNAVQSGKKSNSNNIRSISERALLEEGRDVGAGGVEKLQDEPWAWRQLVVGGQPVRPLRGRAAAQSMPAGGGAREDPRGGPRSQPGRGGASEGDADTELVGPKRVGDGGLVARGGNQDWVGEPAGGMVHGICGGSGSVRGVDEDGVDGGDLYEQDDVALAVMASSYREYEWVLGAAASGEWPQLVEWEDS